MVAHTYDRIGDDIVQYTGRGPVAIDGPSMLEVIMASHDKLLRESPARIFDARKLRALHAELYELVHPKGADLIPLSTGVSAKFCSQALSGDTA